jgi:hypothetical protein
MGSDESLFVCIRVPCWGTVEFIYLLDLLRVESDIIKKFLVARIMFYTNICGKCGNVFQKTWDRCKHCGAKRAWNYPGITIALMTIIIILLVYLIFQA